MAKILVIDDDGAACTLLGFLLKGEGHEVAMFESAKRAMASLSEGAKFDLVVTDLLMPEMDGIDVIRALRRRGASPLILAVSGAISTPEVDLLKAALNLGAQGALKKPFTNEAFLAVVADLLASGRSPRR